MVYSEWKWHFLFVTIVLCILVLYWTNLLKSINLIFYSVPWIYMKIAIPLWQLYFHLYTFINVYMYAYMHVYGLLYCLGDAVWCLKEAVIWVIFVSFLSLNIMGIQISNTFFYL